MGDKRLVQAAKEQKLAEDALKTSLFGNWKADTDNAAHHYSKAGELFKASKSFTQSKTCLINAAKQYTTSRVFFSVGKCYEQAAQCCRELKEHKECYELIEKAGYNYIQNGTNSAATQCLIKGAALISDTMPDEAVSLYVKAGDLEVDNDKLREAVNCYTGAMKVHAKVQQYDKCLNVVKTLREVFVNLDNWAMVTKMDMTIVILHLARGDSVAAKLSDGELTSTAFSLITAVEDEDLPSLKALSQHSEIVYLDTDIARIARHLTLNGAEVPKLGMGELEERKYMSSKPKSTDKPKTTTSLLSQRDELFGTKKNASPVAAKRSPKPRVDAPVVEPAPVVPVASEPNPFGEEESNQEEEEGKEEVKEEGNPFEESDEDLC